MAEDVLLVDCSISPARVIVGGARPLEVRELGPRPVAALGQAARELVASRPPQVVGYVAAPGSVLVQRAAAAFVRAYAATVRVSIVRFTAMEATAWWLGAQGISHAVILEPLGRRRVVIAEACPSDEPPVRAVSVVEREALDDPDGTLTAGSLGSLGRPDDAFLVGLVLRRAALGFVTAPSDLAPVYLAEAGVRRSFLERGTDGRLRRVGG
jgi:hypothetical protein